MIASFHPRRRVAVRAALNDMSNSEPDKPLAYDAYEQLAEEFAARVDTKPHNAYYDRPATLSLLPEVEGKRVLDAGCGPGAYAEWLVAHGASVVGIDASDKMVELARERLDGRAQVRCADFGKPLEFLEDASFDIVLCALALDYIENWHDVFREFHRVLRVPGYLVFSVEHPFDNFVRYKSQNYFATELVYSNWKSHGQPVRMPAYRRPIGAVVNPLLETGFMLERLLEPTPTPEFKEHDPQEYEVLCRQPGFLSVRAAKISNY